MTGGALHGAASEPRELLAYDAAHVVDSDEARRDRHAFLSHELTLAPSVE
jgi:hypothetical protein